MADVLIAGGGSGGHIFPGLAIAERLVDVDPSVGATFVCSQRAIDRRILEEADATFRPIPARPWSIRPAGFARFVRSTAACRRALRPMFANARVGHVLAMGGFVAAPVVAAANRHGVPTTLVNLDATPGKANRWLAHRCARVVSAVPVPSAPSFAERITGMPLRRRAVCTADPATCRRQLGLREDLETLVVVGGSLGATSVNGFAAAYVTTEAGRFAGWQVLHLCGDGDAELRAGYRDAGVPAVVLPFSDRMDLVWGAADLAVSRAGASSVAEAAANAVPTLFMPYPFHRDRHQWANARPLVDDHAAAIADDQVDAEANLRHVGPVLAGLMADPARRHAMRSALRNRAAGDAAAEIARLILTTS
jgi:UDP-N-acetylglucosamine--N-acetylmuramyl-(pentapeptide) pyrophosphoryl-undecaprenol N-acetylglucosamine transferase